jgi:hypothetical protein
MASSTTAEPDNNIISHGIFYFLTSLSLARRTISPG